MEAGLISRTQLVAVASVVIIWCLIVVMLYFGYVKVDTKGNLEISAITAAAFILLLLHLFKTVATEALSLIRAIKNMLT